MRDDDVTTCRAESDLVFGKFTVYTVYDNSCQTFGVTSVNQPLKIEPTCNPSPTPPPERLVYSLSEVAHSFCVSRRTIERERAAARFPKPDLHIGKRPLWARETLIRWIAGEPEGGAS